ncbi:alpha/beta fold hydrolase [Streptomyces parvulus]|uniref:alpha/beta fold hydrolase n=1 Tax=Streptomyces parvulus TaxID=146923 RepID=UPI0037F9F982
MEANEKCRDIVIDAWCATLESNPTSDREHFFDAGGNSILLVHLQARLSEALGFKFPLREIFKDPTVAGLAERVSELNSLVSPTVSGVSEGRVNLYCLPYAGCSARVYDSWKAQLPQRINVLPLELPGRGSRCTERPISTLSELLEDLASAMGDTAQIPYAIFGHSFGGIIAYELVHYLTSKGVPAPRALIVSASKAPHRATPEEASYQLSNDEFKGRLRALRGTPAELLENDELMELYIPVIRADYTILDRYTATESDPLECPILALFGSEDSDADRAAVDGWRGHTRASFEVGRITGDHFFLHASESEVTSAIGAYL